MEALVGFAFVLFFLALGLVFGTAVERRHFRNLDEREALTSAMLVTQLKSFPQAKAGDRPPAMFVSEVVIASDYLKNFLAGLRKFFGGRINSYQSLMVRARREATLRILEEARQQGYNAVCNLRLTAADIGGATQNSRRPAMVAILASGTAYHA